MSPITVILLTILYLAIGVCLDSLFGTGDMIVLWVLWPLPLILAVALYFCIYLPAKLGKWIKGKLGR